MKKSVSLLIVVILFSGCDANVSDRTTPKGAFSGLAKCIDTASTECLYRELDNETRGTVSAIHTILKETRAIVEKSYPADPALRNSVYGKWQQESAAQRPEEMFDILCRRHQCLASLARGFGAISNENLNGDTAVVKTVRNESFTLRRSGGNWGIVLLEKELAGERIRLSDSLKQVKRNAAEYEQQRLATGRTD